MEGQFLYDITLDEQVVANSGDFEFDTEAEAQADADDFIVSELSKEYNRKVCDFQVLLYKAIY